MTFNYYKWYIRTLYNEHYFKISNALTKAIQQLQRYRVIIVISIDDYNEHNWNFGTYNVQTEQSSTLATNWSTSQLIPIDLDLVADSSFEFHSSWSCARRMFCLCPWMPPEVHGIFIQPWILPVPLTDTGQMTSYHQYTNYSSPGYLFQCH